MIHFDANFIITGLDPNTRENQQVKTWAAAGEVLQASVVAWTEFICGPLTPSLKSNAALLLGTPLPFDSSHTDLAAELFNYGGRRRGSLSDCMIASVAITAGAELATRNTSDFQRFRAKGLKLAVIIP